MKVSLIVHVRHARLEAVALDMPHLAGLVRSGGLDQGPVVHQRLPARLAVDGPGWAVVVRLTLPGARVVVGEDAEPQIGVLVEDLPLGHVVADVALDEALVRQHLLDESADLLPPFGSGLRGEDATTRRRELLEILAHALFSFAQRSSTA